jgi:glutamate racemase
VTDPLRQAANQKEQPIGVFDSGLGGLTVVRQLQEQLPNESIIYFGDTARVPYGNKGAETIRRFSLQVVRFLEEQGVKLIVIACNTVSSVALELIQETAGLPVVGVIEPGARAALHLSNSKRIGVIGTIATIAAGKYPAILNSLDSEVKVFAQACPLLVPLVEEGWLDSPVTEEIARIYLAPLLPQKIDCLILGCTHYPLIKTTISKVINGNIQIVDSAIETALEVRRVMQRQGLLNDNTSRATQLFYVSDFPQKFEEVAQRLLGRPLVNVKQVNIDD